MITPSRVSLSLFGLQQELVGSFPRLSQYLLLISLAALHRLWSEAVQVVSCTEEAADGGVKVETCPHSAHCATQPGERLHPLQEGAWFHFSQRGQLG